MKFGRVHFDQSPFCDDHQHGRCDTWLFLKFFAARCGVCRAWFFGTFHLKTKSTV